MRLFTLMVAFITLGGSALLRADSTLPHPISVALVQAPEGDWPDEGNVQVNDADGKSLVVSKDGRDSKPKVVDGGLVGWVHAIGHDPKYGCTKTVLLIKSTNGSVKTWECNGIFIEDWGLVDDGAHLVIRSMQHHGNDFFIEYDLETGRKLDAIEDYVAYSDLPKWAKSVADPTN